ncbi:hypothetical protein EGT67_16155 [Prescottella agglutinans]|uniref:Uncharacterized protein n=1 Tax=Prescottella agglutinans TaxID=1644129 RepID=A0A438BBZ7_9NOCA|nr:hypothetical protein EGT67_16155 [Prescottella agglutinans]
MGPGAGGAAVKPPYGGPGGGGTGWPGPGGGNPGGGKPGGGVAAPPKAPELLGSLVSPVFIVSPRLCMVRQRARTQYG